MSANLNSRSNIGYRIFKALVLLLFSITFLLPNDLRREEIRIDGPEGRPCLGTIWTQVPPKTEPAKGVILIGHGFTYNQGLMATMAKAFSRAGYVAVTFDFWGHGRSRERFGWAIRPKTAKAENPEQVTAWCKWARQQFPGMPLAYLGHSMGGFAGAMALSERPDADAFVALGSLPNRLPSCKTLIAAGQYEELFTPERARQETQGRADVIISPLSDHAVEQWDPVLVQRIIAWVDNSFGKSTHPFQRNDWSKPLYGVLLGFAAALMLAEFAVEFMRRPENTPVPLPDERRRSINPYLLTGRLLGCKGSITPPLSGTLKSSIAQGLVFSIVFLFIMSQILDDQIFTCNLTNVERLLGWAVLTPVMVWLSLRNAHRLEEVPLKGAFMRFAVRTLTQCLPLLVLCIVLRLVFFPIAFLGMVFGMFAFIFLILAIVYAIATRGTMDYRAGAVASGSVFAWILAFWLPLI